MYQFIYLFHYFNFLQAFGLTKKDIFYAKFHLVQTSFSIQNEYKNSILVFIFSEKEILKGKKKIFGYTGNVILMLRQKTHLNT